MTELDKKTQKAQTDLVQAVLEAQEKKNLERVDILVTNAIKQLKMSRFKPDQTSCLSLTYLARISPKVFNQSNAIKEVLKSLLRRDNGPANIKGKNDIVLPILAANILLACCDSAEVRLIILQKIDQWLGPNQKANDMIQNLLATLCMKSQGDQQTVGTLVEMRLHWLQYLEDNYETHGPVPSDLCISIRRLLHSETNCEPLITYLQFLIKHDRDIGGLGEDISRFIIERPISLNNMLVKEESGVQLSKMILRIFTKLFKHLKSLSSQAVKDQVEPTRVDGEEAKDDSDRVDVVGPPNEQYQSVIVKLEPKEEKPRSSGGQLKTEIKSETVTRSNASASGNQSSKIEFKADPTPLGANASKKEEKSSKLEEEEAAAANQEEADFKQLIRSLYVKLPDCAKVVVLSKYTLEAVISLLTLVDSNENCREQFDELLDCLLNQEEMVTIHADLALTTLYNLPDRMRRKLVHSSNDLLVQFGLFGAKEAQLLRLLQEFALPLDTINKILKRLEPTTRTLATLKAEVKDISYFVHLVEFYSSLGAAGASKLLERLELVTATVN